MSALHRLQCAATWAGNERVASLVELAGLAAWVHSVPAGPGEAGGDVHYVSVCPSCVVSRVALADVSGHGQAVASVSTKLRELMQQHLTALEQTDLMRDLNQAVQLELDSTHYATMVAVGFHSRRGLLVLTNAGHPPPFWYRAKRDEWAWLERQQPVQRASVVGTPLGLLPDISYDRMIVKLNAGDLVVLYTDGVFEATNQDGQELGRDGLIALARQLDSRSPEAFGTQLAEALRDFRGGTVPQDDETIIVLQRALTPLYVKTVVHAAKSAAWLAR